MECADKVYVSNKERHQMYKVEYKLKQKNSKVHTSTFNDESLFSLVYMINNHRADHQYITIWF